MRLLAWSLLCALLLLALGWGRIQWQWHQQLMAELPPKVAASLVNSQDRQTSLERSTLRLAQMTLTPRDGPGWLFAPPQLTELALEQAGEAGSPVGGEAPPFWRGACWPLDGQRLCAHWQLQLVPSPSGVALTSLLMGGLLSLAGILLPSPRRWRRWQWRHKLARQGVSPAKAPQLAASLQADPARLQQAQDFAAAAACSLEAALDWLAHADWPGLDASGRDWLALALRQGLAAETALAVACHPPQLHFDLAARQVVIHGLPLRLSRTPLLYFYWYAQRRRAGLPGYVNPASHRPDRAQGQALAALMRQHGGHGKAIAELEAQGLRSKTLDQNRNRIRDELRQALGPLAEPYLFDSTRDGATARYCHGLLIPAEQIGGILDESLLINEIGT
ncbi:hypothetical protein GCM10023095_05330 [Pseudaeromonas paramecii]|uniref:Uncharacterized protein n=1 Tax=Pseudaeromonas paramecii TaxID=2138166 RepID=A0ABP8PXF4_9GAMM